MTDDGSLFVPEVRRLVRDLVEGRLDELVADGRAGQLGASELRALIDDYPGQPTHPAEAAFSSIDVIEVEGRDPRQFVVHFDLWYDGERSDLTLIADAWVHPPGQVKLEIYDLHVL